MHIKNNFFKNLFFTMMDIKGKKKDNLNGRLDLNDLEMHPKLYLIGDGNTKFK